MLNPVNAEWPYCNEVRSYPIAADATKQDTGGTFTLPDSFLVELSIAVPATIEVDPANFHLSSLTIFPAGYQITLSYYDPSTGSTPVAILSVSRALHTEPKTYIFTGLTGTSFWDVTGQITLGRTAEIDQLAGGQFTFDYDAGKLDPDCVRPQLRNITALYVVNGSNTFGPYYGDVQLIAGNNIQLSIGSNGSMPQIRFDAIEGAGLTDPCECQSDVAIPPPIRTINGIPPKASGDFDMLGYLCLTLAPMTNGLELRDTCATPCCGYPELTALQNELKHLGDELTTVAGVLDRLGASVDQTTAVILGSRLGDAQCRTC